MENNLSNDIKQRLDNFPLLKSVVGKFIFNDGCGSKPGYLSELTVYIRYLNLDEPVFFGWDDDIAEDFYSWGHNSRYAHVMESMLYDDLEYHVSHILDYLESSKIEEPSFEY